MPNSVAPVSNVERIQELDIFRGFAIFGIFMVNILVMNISFVYRGEWMDEQKVSAIQQVANFIQENFFFGKFFVIFSFLFGIGVALQILKAKEKGIYSNAFFIRRFASLFLFGIAHILFIWSGDILHLYGALGFLLMPLFRLKSKALAWLAAILFLFPFYYEIFAFVVSYWLDFDHMAPLAAYSREGLIELKHHGSYLSGIILRMKEYSFFMGYVSAGIVPAALVMMLLGGAFVKTKGLENLDLWVRKGKLIIPISALVFFIYRLVFVYYVKPNFEIEMGSVLSITLMTLYYLEDIGVCFFYLWLIVLVLRYPWGQKLLNPLALVGRMALSNYILQSVLGYLIMRTFNGYETYSPMDCIAIVLGIFAFQTVLSKYWLRRFKFGPLEWVWRCISYWKLLPIVMVHTEESTKFR